MLVILSGVSGSGKDTIKKALIKQLDNVESLPSYTSRAPREGEVPGEIYNFVSKEKFEQSLSVRHLKSAHVSAEKTRGKDADPASAEVDTSKLKELGLTL